ncbi:hypothetical protein M0R45_004393 [Rubus argutus]|uniref:Uncharacterized protein n=1 Tax=Rubus argutus TaxID=59490 RepID=A0AAW1YJQ5_RUBAR
MSPALDLGRHLESTRPGYNNSLALRDSDYVDPLTSSWCLSHRRRGLSWWPIAMSGAVVSIFMERFPEKIAAAV